jgi:putative Ca2+/H+ antiporter (TMEM165/GDT1 family)
MEPLLFSAVAAFLAAWGDRTQALVAMLAGASRRPAALLSGLIPAIILSNALAAAAGHWLAGSITLRALSLLTALALLFAGLFGLIPRKAPAPAVPRLLPLSVFLLCLAAETGDRIQFLTFAFAGRYPGGAPLAAAGASLGLFAACLPAVLLGEELRRSVPLRAIRYGVAMLFLVAGFIIGVKALQLA